MNTPQYRKQYMANLNLQISNNNNNFAANAGNPNPSTAQYIQNTKQSISGVPKQTSNYLQPKGTRIHF